MRAYMNCVCVSVVLVFLLATVAYLGFSFKPSIHQVFVGMGKSAFDVFESVFTSNITTSNTRIPALSDVELVFIGDSKIELHSSMSNEEADVAFIKFISRVHVVCDRSARMGKILDGGWDMCLAGPFRPRNPCLVYSFGINFDFSFDDAVANTFGCTVRSFDPSMKTSDYRRNTNVWFYATGIGGADQVNAYQWNLKTLSTLLRQFNESNATIDYLKMDVEGAEWPSLANILTQQILSRVKQIGIELHIDDKSASSLYVKYQILKRLEDVGFRRWHFSLNLYNLKFTTNGFRSCCYEMSYINVNFLKPLPSPDHRLYYFES